MYAAAGRLDPDSAHAVALLAYREMVAAGYVAVGEFHYVHHRPDGTPYAPANAMALATAAAADEAGIDQVLLMTAYERAGAGLARHPRSAPVLRPDCGRVPRARRRARAGAPRAASGWLRTASAPSRGRGSRRSAATPRRPAWSSTSTPASSGARSRSRLAEYGRRPIELLADAGVLGPRTTIVHGTHASDGELDLLAQAGASVCLCPTTEANLGDGYLPALRLFERGIRVCIGTDSNTVIDPVVELREIEAVARRTAERRNVLVPAGADGPTGYLLDVGSRFGAEALGLAAVPAEVELDLSHPTARRRRRSPTRRRADLRRLGRRPATDLTGTSLKELEWTSPSRPS